MIPARWERPYVDRPVADSDRADLLARSSAAHWGLPEPALLRSSMNRVYVAGEVIVRIGHVNGRGESQLDLAARLAALEIAVPQPAREETLADGDLVVTAWRRATGAGSVDWSRSAERSPSCTVCLRPRWCRATTRSPTHAGSLGGTSNRFSRSAPARSMLGRCRQSSGSSTGIRVGMIGAMRTSFFVTAMFIPATSSSI